MTDDVIIDGGLAPLSRPADLDGPAVDRTLRRRSRDATCRPTDADALRVRGELVSVCVRYQSNAAGITDGQRATLHVRLMLPGGLVVDAAEDVGTTPPQHIAAQRRARSMRAGQIVTAYGKGALTMPRGGTTVLVLLHPSIHADPAPARHEPADRSPGDPHHG